MKEFLKKLQNPGTIVALVSLTIIILGQFGIAVDNNKVMNIVYALCSILCILGFTNNPSTPGLDLPFFNEEKGNGDINK